MKEFVSYYCSSKKGDYLNENVSHPSELESRYPRHNPIPRSSIVSERAQDHDIEKSFV